MKFIQHSGSRAWQQVIKQKWWLNQQRAINRVENYLASNSDRQAMVRMPTGTGKTAVIATLAQLLADKPRCLVVAPWEYLVGQLQQELHERFWKKVGEDSSFTPKPCQIFTPSTFTKAQKAAGSAGVLLCTNQTLQALRKDDPKFRKLRSWCTLALVDEGHREPAPRWAEAVRDLDVATVLFTAVRQAALLIVPNVQAQKELLDELRADITQPELPGTQGPSVRIMSLHKSKGLTARLVVIAGCVAGILPSIDFTAPIHEQTRQRQEQRRLFYVGLTRSTETLVISSAVQIPSGVAMQMGVPVMAGGHGVAILQASPFLAELGPQAPNSIHGNTWRANLGF